MNTEQIRKLWEAYVEVSEKIDESRQMKDPKKDSMVTKGGKTIVIDKDKEKEYLKKGWTLAEKKKDDFEPHMMYDPETGKGYKAEKPEDHERMKKMGYTHEKPKVEEKKLDPVDDKALDKKFKDRKDKDIDNDGDVDSSDEYLHKRRAAIDNAIDKRKAKKEEEDEEEKDTEDKEEEEKRKEKEKKGMNSKTSDSKAEISKIGETRKEETELDEAKMSVGDTVRVNPKSKNISDRKKLGKSGYIKSKRGKDYLVKFADGSSVLASTSDLEMVKEDTLGEAFEVLWDAIQEASEPKNRKANATEPEGIMDKESPKSKEFADKHKKSQKEYEDMPKDAAEKTTKAGQGVKSQAAARPGDNMKGDKKVVNPVKEDTRSERQKIMDILSGKTWEEARKTVAEDFEELDEKADPKLGKPVAKGKTYSYMADIRKIPGARGAKSLENKVMKTLKGKYEVEKVEVVENKPDTIVKVTIAFDKRLTAKHSNEVRSILSDADLMVY